MEPEGVGTKITITGCCGSGKSTLAHRLADRTGLPLFHLDMIWWRPDESHISQAEFDKILTELTAEEHWIIEGDYSRTYEVRLRTCDTLIFSGLRRGNLYGRTPSAGGTETFRHSFIWRSLCNSKENNLSLSGW